MIMKSKKKAGKLNDVTIMLSEAYGAGTVMAHVGTLFNAVRGEKTKIEIGNDTFDIGDGEFALWAVSDDQDNVSQMIDDVKDIMGEINNVVKVDVSVFNLIKFLAGGVLLSFNKGTINRILIN